MTLLNSDYKPKDLTELNRIPSLSLAYLGDAVYEILVRDYIVSVMGLGSHNLHKSALSFVSAPAQAEAVKKLTPHLTEEEKTVYKRGRNTKVNSVPKNATIEQYHAATGLETLFGYLYLKGDGDRIHTLFTIIIGEENAI